MQLSQSLFSEITGVRLDAPQNTSGSGAVDGDRRLHRRVAFDHRARIFPLMEGVGENGAAVLIRDISVSGIGFLYGEPISVSDEFVIRLPTTGDQPIDIQCAARRCELSGTCGSQFAVGATFELVLNRPLSTSIAPESEMACDEEGMVDQPAPPTIEQRYDHQCAVSRTLKPIIRQTRLDRWLARPSVKRIHKILASIFAPLAFIWISLRPLLRIGEASQIRSRLSAGRSSRKMRAKKQARSTPSLPVAMPSPATDVAVAAISSPRTEADALKLEFAMATAQAIAAGTSVPHSTGSQRASLFTRDAVQPEVPPQATPLPPVTPVVAEIPAIPEAGPEAVAPRIEVQAAPAIINEQLQAQPDAQLQQLPVEVPLEQVTESTPSIVAPQEIVIPPVAPLPQEVVPQVVPQVVPEIVPEVVSPSEALPTHETLPQASINQERNGPPLKSRPPSPVARHSRKRARSHRCS